MRAWVPACATGEEAFSVAIVLDEVSRRLPNRPRVTVFASDIDHHAIAVARAANYPAAIANDVSAERLAQYFTKDGNRYRLAKSLRDLTMMANSWPHLDGYRLAAQLRQIASLRDVPIVALTGRPVGQESAEARAAGIDAMLAKPFSLQALADGLRARARGWQAQ